eukprot:EG_transcript_53869
MAEPSPKPIQCHRKADLCPLAGLTSLAVDGSPYSPGYGVLRLLLPNPLRSPDCLYSSSCFRCPMCEGLPMVYVCVQWHTVALHLLYFRPTFGPYVEMFWRHGELLHGRCVRTSRTS